MNQKNKRPALFAEFPGVSATEWSEKIKRDLKGEAPENLIWTTYEGIAVRPFYSAEATAGSPLNPNSVPGQFPYVRGHQSQTNHWLNLPEIIVNANADSQSAIDNAVQALAGGADGVHFKLDHPQSFDLAYAGSRLNFQQHTICFSVASRPHEFINRLYQYLNDQGISPHGLKGFINCSQPLSPDAPLVQYNYLDQLLDLTKDSVDFYGVTVDGATFGNRGANLVQEIAFTLSAAVDSLDALTTRGIPAETVFRNMQLLVSVGTHYFLEIAKLRALRWLWAAVVQATGTDPAFAAYLRLHAQTSTWYATTFDPHTNMLRTTTEAMSAVMGGCDSISVAPFDVTYSPDNPFSARIARNIPLLLQHEAYLHQALDPAAGSYYLESMTQELAEKAWELFQTVENRGGYFKALQSGFILEQLHKSADEKFKNIATGHEVLVGTNKFANKHEKIDYDAEALLQSPAFDTTRASYPFEVMRLAAMLHYAKQNQKPKAIIAIIGHDIQEHIHAAFAKEFFDCGDFDTEVMRFDTAQESLEKLLFTACKVIVLSSTQSEYQRFAQQFTEALKQHKNRPLLILAASPAEMKEEMEENGFDGRIFQNCNTRSIISRIQERLLTNEL